LDRRPGRAGEDDDDDDEDDDDDDDDELPTGERRPALAIGRRRLRERPERQAPAAILPEDQTE
jgi:hypothetical protein